MKKIKLCEHEKHIIVEREFYINQKGSKLICKKCGKTKFIKDIKKAPNN